MESNNLFWQELPSESSAITASAPDNSTNQELNNLELDAIAGGCSDAVDRAQAAGIPVLTISGPGPKFRGPSMQLIEAATRAFGNQQ
ncbi:hypothetical protein Osc7112_5985 [Oscillatoria nigro-viridis PCC 7112]|uniref:Uncharacterized protein n=1 Tax=Phormidium nigroviride PCC 7112 TaxID=179408 RepID=K9VRJ1_9CYAN|nr:hypothetical protein [Oscillatoria nigro-viridis]AFZ10179.1 hypothetical protein Osc7112_5985 [Oscillatoria nigro-viridis PCC 7112]